MTPLLTATPSSPPTYNPSMADTFSWIPVEGAGRPLFARATYIANASDISVGLSSENISVYVDELENLTSQTNLRLDALTAVDYATEAKQDTSNTLLDRLTAIQENKQDQIITLLHSITGTAIEVDLNTDQLELHVDGVETLLNDLTASNKYVPGWSIPPYDEISFEYVGSTDIFRKVTYLNNSTQVMALSFVYVTEPPTAGNAIIQTVKKI